MKYLHTWDESALTCLLGRDLIEVNLEPLRTTFAGRSVMVTGAAGSIGAELCSRILSLGPGRLICVDRDETALFELEQRFARDGASAEFCVDDVADSERIQCLLREHRVNMIFHAAAYKHVPLMEKNPAGAVKNNIVALRRLLRAAEQEGVRDFLLISSDKAVNPASVMGCTKRVGELLLSAWSGRMRTMSVRFGNVLGSQGSVLPLLQQQLREGGPLQVTHPEASRFFMTIREAAELLLLAFSEGAVGKVLVLKIGEPLPIVQLAQRLRTLSGNTNEPIVFTGLRAGEKMHEELFYANETQLPTAHANILRARGNEVSLEDMNTHLDELERLVEEGNEAQLRHALAMIVPEYEGASAGRSVEVKL